MFTRAKYQKQVFEADAIHGAVMENARILVARYQLANDYFTRLLSHSAHSLITE
ncbi:MAG: hypothetical protein ACRC55_03540 [Plesiomonas sp.]